MDCFVCKYQPEKYAAWIAGKDVGPHPENDQSKLYAGSRSRFVHTVVLTKTAILIFTRESSYCFQRILAIAILSVCLSVTQVDQSKMVQARITKASLSATWKTLVLGTIKLFHKF